MGGKNDIVLPTLLLNMAIEIADFPLKIVILHRLSLSTKGYTTCNNFLDQNTLHFCWLNHNVPMVFLWFYPH